MPDKKVEVKNTKKHIFMKPILGKTSLEEVPRDGREVREGTGKVRE